MEAFPGGCCGWSRSGIRWGGVRTPPRIMPLPKLAGGLLRGACRLWLAVEGLEARNRVRTVVDPMTLPWIALGCVGRATRCHASVRPYAPDSLRLALSNQLRTGTDKGNPTV